MIDKERIDKLKKPISEIFSEFKEDAKFSLETEVGIKHPYQDIGIYCRDDGCIEIFAGDAKIILDGENGNIVFHGNNIINSSENIENISNSFIINESKLNNYWTNITNKPKHKYSPLIARNETSLQEKTIIAGTPVEGQYNVSLDEYLTSKTLFNPHSSINTLSILKNLLNELR